MTFDPERHHRQSTRLRGYDYARSGAYFVTVCSRQRECLFGEVIDGAMVLNECGQVVATEWQRSSVLRAEIELDEWIVMPNHLHGIVIVHQAPTVGAYRATTVGAYGNTPSRDAPLRSPTRTLGAMVRGFKAATTTRINMARGAQGVPVWQRNYHDHIIRDDDELQRIRRYIIANPAQWSTDHDNPNRVVAAGLDDLEPWE